MTNPEIRTSYLYSVFHPNQFDRTIKQTLLKARSIQQVEQFDALVFTGTSGCALGFILAAQLNVGALVIRKPEEASHYPERNHNVEGFMSGQKYLFIDDTIASGATFSRVTRTMLREIR